MILGLFNFIASNIQTMISGGSKELLPPRVMVIYNE